MLNDINLTKDMKNFISITYINMEKMKTQRKVIMRKQTNKKKAVKMKND